VTVGGVADCEGFSTTTAVAETTATAATTAAMSAVLLNVGLVNFGTCSPFSGVRIAELGTLETSLETSKVAA
jgi:hypothetical protein